ncbi:MAG TPA: dienelactone hydrolase family protein [Chitinophagales bacterium]|nr:dienelactone hydrolase family protein [Chitinophagales bacterium]
MKRLPALVLTLVIFYSGFGQNKSCCQMPASNQMLALNESFAATHLPPAPFTLQNSKGRMVVFKTADGKTGRAYVVKSDKPTDKVVFMFHEWWGLNDYIKREADNLQSELGNVDVYALDLFDGAVATTVPEAQQYMSETKDERCRAIIRGAIAMAGSRAKIASIGWCYGGGWSLQSALLEGPQAVACVMYYGLPETDLKKLKTLHCDVLGIFGTQDKFINPEVVKTFEENMKKCGKKITTHSYDADHAFANPSNPKYSKEFAADAHAKALLYLKERLGL